MSQLFDWKWMSSGGILIDGTGDIAFNTGTYDSIVDNVRSRIKSALNGWQLYNIGSDLESLIGNTSDNEAELAVQRQITDSLTNAFLPVGSIEVQTIRAGDTITAYIYLQDSLIATTDITI